MKFHHIFLVTIFALYFNNLNSTISQLYIKKKYKISNISTFNRYRLCSFQAKQENTLAPIDNAKLSTIRNPTRNLIK